MRRSAGISDCGTYRYSLTRDWDDGLPRIAFVMLNPSKADAEIDDPTIRRCIGFAKAWGYGGLIVVNLYPLRATDPAELKAVGWMRDDAYKSAWYHNMLAWADVAQECPTVVAAWGAGAQWFESKRATTFFQGLKRIGPATKGGHPRHPLYLPANSNLETL